MVGFAEKTADVRMAQYESGTRPPKEKLINDIATALEVSPRALDVPDIDSYVGLAYTLFVLEDLYGLSDFLLSYCCQKNVDVNLLGLSNRGY